MTDPKARETVSGNEVVEAARVLLADCNRTAQYGGAVNRDNAAICARYILNLAPGKDVVEGARKIAEDFCGSGLTGADKLAFTIAAFAAACVARERELDCKAADDATLPEGYVWGADALEQFTFGKKRAIAAIPAPGDQVTSERLSGGADAKHSRG